MTPQAETAVVCDSSQYLPAEVIAAKGIGVVSLYVSVDGEQERETEVTDYDDFYSRLRRSSAGATTSRTMAGFPPASGTTSTRRRRVASECASSAPSLPRTNTGPSERSPETWPR